MKFTALVFLILSPWDLHAQSPVGKVVDSYLEGTTTQMMIEAKHLLNTSQTVYLHGGIPITIRETMSMKEIEGVYYYRAYSPEKLRILPGENVFLDAVKKEGKLKRFEQEAVFMKKKYATVTFVEGNKAMINRGSLHNVDKRDVYKVYDSSDQAIGEIELYGVGDFLSVGQLMYPIETGGAWKYVTQNDKAVFAGNRKSISMGLTYLPEVLDPLAIQVGYIFRHGVIIESLLTIQKKTQIFTNNVRMESDYAFPIWIRKGFFYPGLMSPCIEVGLTYFRNTIGFGNTIRFSGNYQSKRSIVPLLGAGLEFFSNSTFHLHFNFLHYASPPHKYDGNNFNTDSLFFIGGASFNW